MRLGIDTGGTFTDAVLLGEDDAVVAKAKAATTHGALHEGLEAAARRVMAGRDAAAVRLVSISTTLATNALAEGRGGRVGLVAIGFSDRDLERADLAPALDGGPLVSIVGGHGPAGHEAAPLDLLALDAALPRLRAAEAVAVAGLFAVREPSHERRVMARLREATGLPVTASHELSAKLNGPRRALTTVLNARLLPLVADLLAAVDEVVRSLGIRAPVTVVRGDGGLMGRDFAATRPVETILSGPAASLVGAAHLAGADGGPVDAFVCDVGGTTSDIGRLDGGRPRIAAEGARVSGWSTMVEAVAMDTFALGGDSEVGATEHLAPAVTLGPRRAVPVSFAADHAALDRQLAADRPDALDGRFAVRVGAVAGEGAERDLLERMDGVTALDRLFRSRSERAVMDRLVRRGLARFVAFTPTDALHVLGRLDLGDAAAARKAATLWARQRDRAGRPLAQGPDEAAERVIAAVRRRMGECLLEAAWNAEGRAGAERVASPVVQECLDGASGAVAASLRLDRPVIGLGAAAAAFLPAAARLAGGEAIVPDHADIANAIGAVVGEISFGAEVEVAADGAGYAVAGETFHDEDAALARAIALAEARARSTAEAAGAGTVEVTSAMEVEAPEADGLRVFVGARATARATGRPRFGT